MMEELMLVNPEDAEPKRHRRKAKALQIIFLKHVRRIRANPDYPEIKAKGKALIGRFTGKHVAGALGGAAATVAIQKAGRSEGYPIIKSAFICVYLRFVISIRSVCVGFLSARRTVENI